MKWVTYPWGLSFRVLPLFLGLVAGCAVGPVWARRVEGQIVDGRSGAPIAGVLVFVAYDVRHAAGRTVVDARWSTTDADGRFDIPGRFSVTRGPCGSVTEEFYLRTMHADFGVHVLYEDDFDDADGRMEITPKAMRSFDDGGRWSSLCGGLTREACDQVCERFPESCDGRPDF